LVQVFSVGHSNRSLDDFQDLLGTRAIEVLVDVRRFPVSRRYPHFSAERLKRSLAAEGTEYVHEPELGGHRAPDPASRNTAWKNDALRGYADRIEALPFRDAVARVVERARRARTCVLCAEAEPEQCHRRILADVLASLGCEVVHLVRPGEERAHALHRSAVVVAPGFVVYPAGGAQSELF
jgi:uncharacterized protein (DUF488 family)